MMIWHSYYAKKERSFSNGVAANVVCSKNRRQHGREVSKCVVNIVVVEINLKLICTFVTIVPSYRTNRQHPFHHQLLLLFLPLLDHVDGRVDEQKRGIMRWGVEDCWLYSSRDDLFFIQNVTLRRLKLVRVLACWETRRQLPSYYLGRN